MHLLTLQYSINTFKFLFWVNLYNILDICVALLHSENTEHRTNI